MGKGPKVLPWMVAHMRKGPKVLLRMVPHMKKRGKVARILDPSSCVPPFMNVHIFGGLFWPRRTLRRVETRLEIESSWALFDAHYVECHRVQLSCNLAKSGVWTILAECCDFSTSFILGCRLDGGCM